MQLRVNTGATHTALVPEVHWRFSFHKVDVACIEVISIGSETEFGVGCKLATPTGALVLLLGLD